MSLSARHVRRIGVLDPDSVTRKFIYRVIERRGHIPVGFTHVGGLQSTSGTGRECDLLLVACLWDVGMAVEQLATVRDLLGPRTPLIFMARVDVSDRLKLLTCHVKDTIISTPLTWIALRRLLRLIAQAAGR